MVTLVEHSINVCGFKAFIGMKKSFVGMQEKSAI